VRGFKKCCISCAVDESDDGDVRSVCEEDTDRADGDSDNDW